MRDRCLPALGPGLRRELLGRLAGRLGLRPRERRAQIARWRDAGLDARPQVGGDLGDRLVVDVGRGELHRGDHAIAVGLLGERLEQALEGVAALDDRVARTRSGARAGAGDRGRDGGDEHDGGRSRDAGTTGAHWTQPLGRSTSPPTKLWQIAPLRQTPDPRGRQRPCASRPEPSGLSVGWSGDGCSRDALRPARRRREHRLSDAGQRSRDARLVLGLDLPPRPCVDGRGAGPHVRASGGVLPAGGLRQGGYRRLGSDPRTSRRSRSGSTTCAS